jgi:hypothetical protein
MSKEPTDVAEVGGQLRICDICSTTCREYEMEIQDGWWRCKDCVDETSYEEERE